MPDTSSSATPASEQQQDVAVAQRAAAPDGEGDQGDADREAEDAESRQLQGAAQDSGASGANRADNEGMTAINATLRWAVAIACGALMLLVPATAAARTLVGTPGKDRLVGGPTGTT